MFLILLVVAGNETTRNALSGGLVAFTRFPDQHRKLLDDPSLIDLAVDEIVRYVSPVMSFMRTVTEDHSYQGVDLEAGDRVFMLYQSANRDETVFDDPDEFRVDRDPNPHLGFGIGTHYCLGANLARAEIGVVFTELFARLRDIRAVDPDTMHRGDSSLVLALNKLPAVFTPESRGVTIGAPESQRSRILAAALTLVSELGAAGTSMRRLASACGLNVATIYHYFPSKADLLRALVEEQRYGERMATDDPPLATALPPHERFTAFFSWVVAQTLEEETVLRLLVGEGMHGDQVARHAGTRPTGRTRRHPVRVADQRVPRAVGRHAPAARGPSGAQDAARHRHRAPGHGPGRSRGGRRRPGAGPVRTAGLRG